MMPSLMPELEPHGRLSSQQPHSIRKARTPDSNVYGNARRFRERMNAIVLLSDPNT